MILGLILSKITKLPLDVALSRMVLRPLGLKNTVASIESPIPLPTLHAYSGERGPFFPPGGEMIFEADFPPPMGGTGSGPNPLAYCSWGGLACYAMTFAQEAARQGVQIKALRAHAQAEVDQTRALGLTDRPPVECRSGWVLASLGESDGDFCRLNSIDSASFG